MKTAAERMRERLGKERVMTSISFRVPERMIDDLKEIGDGERVSRRRACLRG
jgi:hypothetical protein